MASHTPVGVIGVGLMGEVYARRLIAAGFTVIGYDVDPAKNERLANFGAQAGTLADIAQKCDPIVVAVFNTEQVEDVVEHALIPAAAGKIVLVTSTCDPDRIAALGARVGDKLRFLETPVSGTSEQVRQGDGVGLIGGDKKSRPMPRRCSTRCSPRVFTSARSATAAAPSSRSISSSASTAWRSPKGWSLPPASGSIRRRSSTSPVAQQQPRRSWTPRDRK